MKKVFIQAVPNQPYIDGDPAKGTNLKALCYRMDALGFDEKVSVPTTSPLIPIVMNTVEECDEVEVIMLMKVPGERVLDPNTEIRPYMKENLRTVLGEYQKVFDAKNMLSPPRIEVVEVPEEECNSNMLLVFNELRKKVGANTSLSCDVTFGNKSMVILLFNLIRYFNRKLDDFSIDYFVYGDRDWSGNGQNVIYDQSFEFLIDDVITSSLVKDKEALDEALFEMTRGSSLKTTGLVDYDSMADAI